MKQGNTADDRHPVLARRRRTVLTTAAAAALLSIGGLVGSTFVQSPSQAAADAQAPRASVITAPVTRQVLRSTLTLRGVFTDGKAIQVSPTSVAATVSNPGGAAMVVTGTFTSAGKQVGAGKPLLEYSGRPVFLLPGKIPAYRDLLPGETGKDVEQLQKALRSLGFGTAGDPSAEFGAGTKEAVRRLYDAMGYPVPTTGPATAAAVKAAQQQLDAARAALRNAESGSTVPGGTPAVGTPSGNPSAAPNSAGGTLASGSGDISALKQQVTSAQTAFAQAQAVDGPMLPASEAVFVPSLPVRVVSVPVAVGDPVKGSVLTLSQGGLQLTGMLDPSDRPLVKAGTSVQVLNEATGAQMAGTIGSIGALVAPGDTSTPAAGNAGAQQQSTNGGAAYLPLVIQPEGAWDPGLANQNVRITITAAASDGAVLAVPEAAITAQSDTTTSVTVQDATGGQRRVRVKTGVSANGFVQVTPLDGDPLAAGDRVVVGS